MAFPIRSPRDMIGGISVFGRILDKIRLNAEGKLPEGYHIGVIPGKRTFDDRVCRLLGIEFEDLQKRTLEGGTYEEILDWCFDHGRKPDQEQIDVWNAFMRKRGWNDEAGLVEAKQAAGFEDREDIQTFFDLMDAEERP
ncbi:DUF5069 domain-containing protein [Luteolibacter sp. LG18]|uniref:DUF5069 domain-containing protein n=1 Tax=Luteolibacter sp. LG18 TaxID=2819286 RepID=UPI002B313413|nr:hypothetical protein llg_35260 [Luteolibacter sp. LG18]